MSRMKDATKMTPPSLSEMMSRYLERQTAAQTAGIAAPNTGGDVVPFEAAPVQPVDPRLAWNESLAAARFMLPQTETKSWQAPPDWGTLVGANEPVMAVACCLGNFPQLVRDLHGLMQAKDITSLRPTPSREMPASALLAWVDGLSGEKQVPKLLLAVAALRLSRHLDRAAEVLDKHLANVPAEWRSLVENEKAALAWHRGRFDDAVALWKTQPASAPILFNLGMAALFNDNAADARTYLADAIARIPEDSAWHHLARLYLALAEMRA